MADRFTGFVELQLAVRAAAVLTIAGASAPAGAVEYQIHGYAAQGFVLSSDNNFFGESSEGSFDYYETGINAAVQVRPNLMFAAQVAVRDAGITDDGTLRLDYALIDYRLQSDATAQAGLRAGKVKNAVGFYNETRDVVFTRPSILLPALYTDNLNARSLIFAAPGAQIYASTMYGEHELSFTGTANAERDVRESDERLLIDLRDMPYDVRLDTSWNAQIIDSFDGGRWQFAYSRFSGQFRLKTAERFATHGRFAIDLDVFSVRYNAEKFTLTAEYMLAGNDGHATLRGIPLAQDITGETGYLQAEYRINYRWGALARMDTLFADRNDRNGRKFVAANPGTDRRARVSHDFTLGLNWRPDEHWGVWGEYHWINGTGLLQVLENPPPIREQRWTLLMLMAGFKF